MSLSLSHVITFYNSLWPNDTTIVSSLVRIMACRLFQKNDILSIGSLGTYCVKMLSLQRRDNERDGVSNYQPHDCLPNRLFSRRSKKILKLRVTGLCAQFTGER